MVNWTFFVRHFPWETPFFRQKTKGQKKEIIPIAAQEHHSPDWKLQNRLWQKASIIETGCFNFFGTVFHLLVPVILFVGVWGFWFFSHKHKTKIHINEMVEETIVNLKGGKINECTFPVWFMLTEHNLGVEVHCFAMYCKRNYFIIEM